MLSSPTPTLEMQTPSHSSPTLRLSSSPTSSTDRAYDEPQVINAQSYAHPGMNGQSIPQPAWYGWRISPPPPPRNDPFDQNAHSHHPPPSTHPIGPQVALAPHYYSYPYPPHQLQANIPYWGVLYASQGYYPATYGQPSPAAPAHGPWQHWVLPSIPSLHSDSEHPIPQTHPTHSQYPDYDRGLSYDASHAPRVGNFARSIGEGRAEWPTHHTNNGSTSGIPGRTDVVASPAPAQEVGRAWANPEDNPPAQDGKVIQEAQKPVCHEASPAGRQNHSSKAPRKRKSRAKARTGKESECPRVQSLLEQLIHCNAVPLCEQYIMESKNGKLLLSQVYQRLMDDFPILIQTNKNDTKRWHDTIRNILSTKRRFYRVKRPHGEHGHGDYWKVNPDEKGSKTRHRASRLTTSEATSTFPSRSFSPMPTSDQPCPSPSTSVSGLCTLEMAMVTRMLPRISGMPALLSPEEIFT